MSVPIIWSSPLHHTFFLGRALFPAQPLSTLAQPGSGFSEVPPLVCEHPQLQVLSLDYESGCTNFYSLLPSKEHVLSIRVSKRYSTIFIGVPAITEYLKGKQKELQAEPAGRMGRGKSLFLALFFFSWLAASPPNNPKLANRACSQANSFKER